MKTLCFALVCGGMLMTLPSVAAPAPLAASQPVFNKPALASPVTIDILSADQVIGHLVIPAGQAGLSFTFTASSLAQNSGSMLLNGNVVLSVLQNGKLLYHIDADEMRISHLQNNGNLSNK